MATEGDLQGAVESGDHRRALVALRDHLAACLVGAEERYAAGLAKQLGDVLRELNAMPVDEEASVVDDLVSRRAARRAAASGQ